MSAVTTMTFGRPARLDTPFLSRAASALLALPARLDDWLERREQARMSVNDVLAFARSIESSDPGFAADLRGAALRAGD